MMSMLSHVCCLTGTPIFKLTAIFLLLTAKFTAECRRDLRAAIMREMTLAAQLSPVSPKTPAC
jgi:hypothetical protein